MERVVVTGLGVASPLGCSVADFWTALTAGCSGVIELEERFHKLPTRIGAQMAGFDERQYFDRKEARRMSRSSQLAMVAAGQAIAAAHLDNGHVDRDEVGVIIGSSIGGFAAADTFFKNYYQHDAISPLIIPISMNPGPSSNVSIRHGFAGPVLAVDAACASAAHSLGYAFYLIRSGQLDIAIAGGADSPFGEAVVAAWCALKALSQRNDQPATACRPFSADRDGMVLGEGAGVLVLESETSARRRGRPVLAEVVGYGATGDGYHLTQPTAKGPRRAMHKALQDARVAPEAISWINAHGTGTLWNDKTETAAIKEVFGETAYGVPVVAHKAQIGHAIAASAALQAVSGVMSLQTQRIPPTVNYTTPDPECDLDYVTGGARALPIERVLINSFAFGGSNAALVLARYHDANGASDAAAASPA
jgi:beta-ketoacyl-acyl-carrier-protein synthase II